MSNILFLTDLHLSAYAINQRTGDYCSQILDKLEYVLETYSPTYLLCGGDIFNSPVSAYSVIGKLVDLILQYQDTEWIIIPGQHDVRGYNFSSVETTPLGILEALPNVTNILNTVTYIDDGIGIAGVAVSTEDVDEVREILKTTIASIQAPTKVVLAHALITDIQLPYPSLLIPELGDVGSATILCGDYHGGWSGGIDQGATCYYNVGAFSRVSRNVPDPPSILRFVNGKWVKEEIPCVHKDLIFKPVSTDLILEEQELLPSDVLETTDRDPLQIAHEVWKQLGYSKDVFNKVELAIKEVTKIEGKDNE